MSITLRAKEGPTRYKMSFITIMESWKAFTSRAMKRPNILERLSLKVGPSKVEPKGWGDNAIKVIPMDSQQKVQERMEMSLSSQIQGKFYKSKEVLCVHEEVQKGLKIRLTNRGYAWQSTSPQYHQPHDEHKN